jgi:hypothetical protein
MGARPTGYVRGTGHHFHIATRFTVLGQIEHEERVPQGPEQRKLARALNEL